MSVHRQTAPNQSDLETTAELPVLDVAAYEAQHGDRLASTDTWVAPPLPASPARTDEAAAQQHRNRVEDDLRALSLSLREFEERLALKGERLSAIEAELETVRGAHRLSEQRASALTNELSETRGALVTARAQIEELTQRLTTQADEARAARARDSAQGATLAERDQALARAHERIQEMQLQSAAQLEVLQSLEGRRGIFEHLLRGLDREVGAGEERLFSLQRELGARGALLRELQDQLTERTTRVASLEGEVSALATALAKKTEESTAATRLGEELRANVRTLTTMGAAQLERMRSIEADASSRAQAQGEALGVVAGLRRDLDEATLAHRQKVEALEFQLASTQGQLNDRVGELHQAAAAHAERATLLAAAETRTAALEAQVTEHAESVRTLHEELRKSAERHVNHEDDLRAADEIIHRQATELQAKSARIEELGRANEEWRARLDAARQALGERDALIRRLETEAAHSAVLLDNIQHSMQFLEPAGGAELAPAPEGATRLLIRSEGEGEVVHVLSRKTSIGRTPDNDLQIETKFISRHHAVILAGPIHTIIEDLNSTNGVLVNGQRITRQTLKDGDAIMIGKTQFRFATRPSIERR
jgi:chromosome segregation ATPase